jgi:hypothetical protein
LVILSDDYDDDDNGKITGSEAKEIGITINKPSNTTNTHTHLFGKTTTVSSTFFSHEMV